MASANSDTGFPQTLASCVFAARAFGEHADVLGATRAKTCGMAAALQLVLTTAVVSATVWVWRAGALLFWVALAVIVVEVLSHILREPHHERHHRRPAH